MKYLKLSKEVRMKRNERMPIVKCPNMKANQSPGSIKHESNTVKHAFNMNCVINRDSKNTHTLCTETGNQKNTDKAKRKSVVANLVEYIQDVNDKRDMCDVDTFDIKPDVSQPPCSNFVIAEKEIIRNTVDLKPDISRLSTCCHASRGDVQQDSIETYMEAINDNNDVGSVAVASNYPEIKILQCQDCWSAFSEVAAYDVHMLKCPTESKRSQICTVCRVAFTDMRMLYTHDCKRRIDCYDYTCGVCSKVHSFRF